MRSQKVLDYSQPFLPCPRWTSLQFVALIDFLPMITLDTSDPDLEGVVPGPIYPGLGVITGILALIGGCKGVRPSV